MHDCPVQAERIKTIMASKEFPCLMEGPHHSFLLNLLSAFRALHVDLKRTEIDSADR